LASSAYAKLKAKVDSTTTSVEKINISTTPAPWNTEDGVSVDRIHAENEEKATLVSIERDRLRASLAM